MTRIRIGSVACATVLAAIACGGSRAPVGTGAVSATATPLQLQAATPSEREIAIALGRATGVELETVRRAEAAQSGDTTVGHFTITYLVTPATGYYLADPGVPEALTWHDIDAPGEVHLSVVVRDTIDGRWVAQGERTQAAMVPRRGAATRAALVQGWYAALDRSGENVKLPSAPFTLRVAVDTSSAPGAQAMLVEFSGVRLRPGAIEHAAQRVASSDALDLREAAQEEGVQARRAVAQMATSATIARTHQRIGDYDVTATVERPVTPARHAMGAYVALVLQDTASGRMIPVTGATASLIDENGATMSSAPFGHVSHPRFDHFAAILPTPPRGGGGRYLLRVHVPPPAVRRYGRAAGLVFRRGFDLELRDIPLG